MIRKTSQGHQIVSKGGKPLSKPNLSKQQAQKRLRQIEYFKKKGGKEMNLLLRHENGLLVEALELTEKSAKELSGLRAIAERDRKPQEFAEYDAYCEKCKREAKEELGL